MLQKLTRLVSLSIKINPARLVIVSSRQFSNDKPTPQFQTNVSISRQLTCPCCANLLHRRSIHHPDTFKKTIKKPFDWGYDEHNGPNQWHVDFPIAFEGKRQSPVDICTSEAQPDQNFVERPLRWKYSPDRNLFIENTGRSWTVLVDGSTSGLAGGPLESEFELWQYHAHWGKTNDHGSEHTIDGKSYPAELHLVHWNSAKYDSPEIAVAMPDGLAVLGLFLEIDSNPHEEFAKVCNLMQKIKFRDQKYDVKEQIDVSKFLPQIETDKKFWSYDGSLTTPPLLESVSWILFKNPMKISQSQLDAMRSLFFSYEEDFEKAKMGDNFRHTRPLGDRIIRQLQ